MAALAEVMRGRLCYSEEKPKLSLALQKSRMPEMQGVPLDKFRGEAVVVYADPFTKQQMRYHRLSRRVGA